MQSTEQFFKLTLIKELVFELPVGKAYPLQQGLQVCAPLVGVILFQSTSADILPIVFGSAACP